jgi:DNA-binding PadR family transcriptional regulator
MKAEMLILGVLHRGNFHPYEIKRRLSGAMVECFTDVDVGTLYYAVRQLAKEALIQPVSQQQVARGGTRTVYRITSAGRERFQGLLHDCFAAEGSVADTLYGAMLFLHFCDQAKLAQLLRAKIERQKLAIEKLDGIARQFRPVLATGGLHLVRHLQAQRKLDLQWLRRLQSDVVAGRVRDVPNPALLRAGAAAPRGKREA